MIYDLFVIWDWTIKLVIFLVYILYFLKINFEPLWISRIYVSLEWAQHIVNNWSRHLNFIIDG